MFGFDSGHAGLGIEATVGHEGLEHVSGMVIVELLGGGVGGCDRIALDEQAQACADTLGLTFERIRTNYGDLEPVMVEIATKGAAHA